MAVCGVYLDDIVVFSNSPTDHIKQARRVLRQFYEARVTVKLNKCKFFAETIHNLSYVIWSGCLLLAEHRTEEAAKLEHSTTKTELHSFVGLCNVFRQHVTKLARLTAALKEH